MGHRGAGYTVGVRRRGAPKKEQHLRLLGDFDEAGTNLVEAIDEVMTDFVERTRDQERAVRSVSAQVAGDELRLLIEHGQSGVVADIRGSGDRYFHQISDDVQAIKCACLFSLPANQKKGALAVHINNGRGVIGLLAKGLGTRLRERYADVTLDLTPEVSVPVLDAAIAQDKVEKVTLVRYERPQDRAVNDTTKWVQANEIGKLELNITARRRGQVLLSDRLRRFRRDRDPKVLSDIVEFGGIPFEQAKVEVELPDGTHRTFNIETPDKGHPITQDLTDLILDDEGEPTPDSLLAALSRIASDVVG